MIAKPFMKYAEPDDLLQESFLGLYEAVYSYRPGEVKFITYLPYRIRKCCIKYLQDTSNIKRLPSSRLTEIRRYKKFCQEYVDVNGHYPDDNIIIQELELTEKRLDNIRKTIYEQNCISIHSTVPRTEDFALEDIIADPSNIEEDVEDKLFKEYEKHVVEKAIASLPEREAKIIHSRYFEDEKQSDIAKKLKLSVSRIGYLEKQALNRLKLLDEIRILHDEVYGYDSGKAYILSKKSCLDKRTSTTEMLALKRIVYEELQKSVERSIDDIFAELLNEIS